MMIAMILRIPEPAVTRRTLVLSAALVWGLVGAFLSIRAFFWFKPRPAEVAGMMALSLAAGFLKGRFLFAKLALHNIGRIRELSPQKEKICLFAFQAVKSYVIVAGMIGLGILIRLSPIRREILGVIYLAVGVALFYGSFEYWRAARTRM